MLAALTPAQRPVEVALWLALAAPVPPLTLSGTEPPAGTPAV
ncbi:hypothetical protein [Streptomyces sp. NPDC051636]